MKRYLTFLAIASCMAMCLYSCKGTPTTTEGETAAEEEIIKPVADSVLTAYAKLYAGIDTAGLGLTEEQKAIWESYSKEIKEKLQNNVNKMAAVDSFSKKEMSDIAEKAKTVFYPFGGPEFFFPSSFYPNSDTYYLMGLEPVGTILKSLTKDGLDYSEYLTAMRNYFNLGYFITSEMAKDLKTALNGTAPLFALQLAAKGFAISSASYMKLEEDGTLVESAEPSKILQIKFFKPGEDKEKTLRYFSNNLKNTEFPADYKAHILKEIDPQSTVTMMKSASYIMADRNFSDIREFVMTHSLAITQDDTGIPYKFFKNSPEWEVSLYGAYTHPLRVFGEYTNQPDLAEAFKKESKGPLPFRIGYNSVPEIMIIRKVEQPQAQPEQAAETTEDQVQ